MATGKHADQAIPGKLVGTLGTKERVHWGPGDVINKRKIFSSHHSGHLIGCIFTQPGAKATNPAVMGYYYQVPASGAGG